MFPPTVVSFPRLQIIGRILTAFGALLLLLSIGYFALAAPNATVVIQADPGASATLLPGEQEQITWVITPDTQQTPMQTVFTMVNQDNVVITQATYTSPPGLLGPYTFVYTLPVTYTTPASLPFERYTARVAYSSGSGEVIDGETIFFVDDQAGRLQIIKFDDLNLNGVRDPGEPGVANVTFRIQFPAPFTDTELLTQTNSAGEILFEQLGTATYTVTEIVPLGTIPTTTTIQSAAVQAGMTTTLFFGNATFPGGIEVTKFHDRDGDGVRDPGEGPLSGVHFEASAPCGQTASGETGADGVLAWPGLCVGEWTITETATNGYQMTTPAVQTVVVTSGVTSTVSFGNQGVGELVVVKFEDLNDNGMQDPGEDVWPGINVVYENKYGDTDSCTTDQQGQCRFQLIPEGLYTVTEILLPNTIPTISDEFTATVAPGDTVTVTFANRKLGFLQINKFEDVDGDGVQDPGEPAWPGVPMIITNAYGDMDTCTTDANGECLFLDLPRGVYTVTETLSPYAEAISGDVLTATVVHSGISQVIFANRRLGDLQIIKFEDVNGDGVRDPNEPAWSGVAVTITNEFGDVDACTTDANGECTFLRRPIGIYTITEEPPPDTAAVIGPVITTTLDYAITRTVAFANRRLGALAAHVFWDINGNGTQDADDPDQPGFSLSYLNEYGERGTGVTDANGEVLWQNLGVGVYTTTLNLANGCQATTADPLVSDVLYGQTASLQFGYRCILYLPLVLQDWPPPTPTPTSTPTPTATPTPTVTPTPSATPIPTSTPGAAKRIEARYGSAVIDGNLDDWDENAFMTLDSGSANRINDPNHKLADPVDGSALIQVRWDESHLYFAFIVRDDRITVDSTDLWQDDSFELGLDGERDKNAFSGAGGDHQYTIRYDGRAADRGFAIENPDVRWAVRTNDHGYQIELVVPCSALGVTQLTSGQILGVDFAINDDDDGGNRDSQLVWASWSTYSDAYAFGELVLR